MSHTCAETELFSEGVPSPESFGGGQATLFEPRKNIRIMLVHYAILCFVMVVYLY